MPINHYSTSDLSQPPHWWSHYSSATTSSPPPDHKSTFCHPAPMAAFDLNNEDEDYRHTLLPPAEELGEEELQIPKERLFEKALTPSDVGKLNRLVIPKQHAERHFPLNGASTAAEPGENGLLLGFEDENGKSWRFRYSYWNSSQSYVLTKGWSRFVKEKRLDAGDVVVFARHSVDTGRFFIGWRRRVSADGGEASRPAAGGAGGWNHTFNNSGQQYPYPGPYQQASSSLPYQQEFIHAGTVVQEKQATAAGGGGSGNSKWLRLFGVNLECHQAAEESDSSTPLGSPVSSHHSQSQHQYYYSNNHMDISFSGGGGGDVYRQG